MYAPEKVLALGDVVDAELDGDAQRVRRVQQRGDDHGPAPAALHGRQLRQGGGDAQRVARVQLAVRARVEDQPDVGQREEARRREGDRPVGVVRVEAGFGRLLPAQLPALQREPFVGPEKDLGVSNGRASAQSKRGEGRGLLELFLQAGSFGWSKGGKLVDAVASLDQGEDQDIVSQG